MEESTSSAPALCRMESRCFDSLPPELLCYILCFLAPRDVIRMRLVSKLFRDITYDSVIWKMIYASAPVPRPPGPFPSQTTRFLERTLIRSGQLAERWATHPIQAVSSTQIRLSGSVLGHPRIIGGRWLITFESYRQIVFYDVETRTRQVLVEDAGLIASWDACSVVSAGELLVYVVFRKNTRGVSRASWKLLEFRVHEESGRLSHTASLDVPSGARYFVESVCLISDKAPFLYITSKHLVFDVRTRIFYEFPEFSSKLDEIRDPFLFMAPRRVLLTNTHVVLVSYRLWEPDMPSSIAEPTLIQAFTLPAGPQVHSATCTARILRLSHEGIVLDHLGNLVLTRNSVTDPVTESTSLRFLRLQREGDRLSFANVDLTLPRTHSDTVLPLSITMNDVFTVERGIYDPVMCPNGYYLEASDDGHARGFCRNRPENDDADSSLITKFSVDATGDECVAVVGQASRPLWFRNEDPPRFSMLSFDGIIGKCCYLESGDSRLRGFVDVAVVDIK